ncbi:MAG: SNF2-related protein [Bacillota bacterium]|nr:SNF2-related protein [Bacillota bacterium]
MRFHPDEDEALLILAQETPPGPPSDLALHRQALGLMLNPGFDTLLSLPMTRGVEPLDYQLATVRHVLKHLRGRALLCDEVGLGKTVEAGLIATEYLLRGLARRILVLTPPSLVEQWQGEMRSKFNLGFVTYDDPVFRLHPDPWRAFPRILASLDTAKLAGHREKILACDYDLVIVDEAHHLKNARTLAHQLVKNLRKRYILLLTATPVENRLEELFNLITLLTPGQLETAASFKRNYISPQDPLKPRNTAGLRELIGEVMVRNRRSETGAISSRRHAEVVEVELSPEEAAFYRQLSAFVREHYSARNARVGGLNQLVLKGLQRAAGSSVEAVAPTLQKLSSGHDGDGELPAGRPLEALAAAARAVSGRAKGDTLAALLRRIGEKTVVFTGFHETQLFLVERLRREGMRVAALHGGMRRQEKEEQVERFRTEADVLVSTEGGSEGRNLHFSRVLVNYDLPWNPMRIEQRIGRLHRLGQTQDVYVYNLSAAGTIEAHILQLLDAKINMFQLVIGELDTILGNLDEKKPFEDLAMDIWSSAADRDELNRGMEALGESLVAAKRQYEAVRHLDDSLLGELLPRE